MTEVESRQRKLKTAEAVARVAQREADAYYANSTLNVNLTPPDPELADDHPFNRQVVSNKGLIADDHIPEDSPLREDVMWNGCGMAGLGLVVAVGISGETIHAETRTASP